MASTASSSSGTPPSASSSTGGSGRRRDCAVCGAAEKRTLYRQRFVLPSANYVHGGYDVAICATCDFAYADELPDQAFFDAYYTSSGGVRAPEEHGNRLENAAQNIARFAKKTDRILDVGCGGGELLELLGKRGFTNLLGLEPGDAYCAAVRARGLEVVQGALSDSSVRLGQFDVVILCHVLEHIEDLRGTTVRVQQLLRPGGRVYIEVPDAEAFNLAGKTAAAKWEFGKDLFAQFCPEHINFFTKVSLGNLLRRTGYDELFLESQVSIMGVVASMWTPRALSRDATIDGELETYIRDSEASMNEVAAGLDAAAARPEGIVVWGAGLHTQRLLANTRLRDVNIHAFVDANPAYAGKVLQGRPIVPPSALATLPVVPILISSRRLQDEIEQNIVALGVANEILLLYPRGAR